MSLSAEDRKNLVNYRVSRAYETWKETQTVIQEKLWFTAANRMYYSCFYMASALMIHNGLTPSSHTGVIRLLGRDFVSTGLLSREMGKFYSQLFELRQRDDYEDYVVITADDVLPKVEKTERFLHTVENLIKNSHSL